VPSAEKWWVLRHAAAVLYPSRVEGFGLIPFESAAVGTPCLAARVSAIDEVCGPDVDLAPSFDVKLWASTVLTWMADSGARARHVRSLQQRRAAFRWAQAGHEMLSVMNDVLELPRRWPADQVGPASVHVERNTPGLSPIMRVAHQSRRAASVGSVFLQRRMGAGSKVRGFRIP
jgi:hypothetical protein